MKILLISPAAFLLLTSCSTVEKLPFMVTLGAHQADGGLYLPLKVSLRHDRLPKEIRPDEPVVIPEK